MKKILKLHKLYKAYRFFFWSFLEKKLFWKAFFWMIFAKIAIPTFAFSRLQRYLGEVSSDQDFPVEAAADRLKIKQVRTAIARASKILPFHCQCLVTAICARKLLKDLGCSPRLYLGVAKEAKEKESLNKGPGLMAHAWVKLGDQWIVGKSETAFTVVKIFA